MNPDAPQPTSIVPPAPAQAPTPNPVPSAPVPPAEAPKGMAITALVLAIVGFVIGLIPFIGAFLSFPLLVAGIILGIIVVAKHKPGRKFGIASIITGGVGIVVSSILFLAFITLVSYNGITERANEARQEAIERGAIEEQN